MTAAGDAPTATTLGRAIDAAAARLGDAGIVDARREARMLASIALDLPPSAMIGESTRLLDAAAQQRIAALTERRAGREPMSHIRGRREFWSLDFAVTGDVLDPRPDSETLVETALALFPDRDTALDILDLGTGTGCLLLAMLHERPRACGLGIDISRAALDVASSNAARLGLGARCTFRIGDWAADVEGRFDLILCNPPYVESDAIAALEPEVARWEPRRALDGGADGLAAYRALAPQFNRLLRHPRGAAVVEFGEGQADAVAAICSAAGLIVEARMRDLAGRERGVTLRPAPAFTNP